MNFFQGVMSGLKQSVLGPDAADPNTTATAYQKLQQQLADQYGQAQQKFEADPNNKGKQYSAPDALTRWSDQVNAMIQSGDPILMKEGLAELSQVNAAGARPENQHTPTAAIQEYQLAQQQGYGGTFADYQKMMHPGTNVHVNVNSGDKLMPISDAKQLVLPNGQAPVGMTLNQAMAGGAQLVQSDTQRQAGAAVDSLTGGMQDLGQALNEGGMQDAVSGQATQLRTGGGVTGALVDTALNAAGVPLNPAAARATAASKQVTGQLTKLLSGAGASEEEYNRVLSQVPAPGQSVTMQKENWKRTQANIQALTKRARAAGIQTPEYTPTDISNAKVTSPIPDLLKRGIGSASSRANAAISKGKKAANQFVTKSGISYTVE